MKLKQLFCVLALASMVTLQGQNVPANPKIKGSWGIAFALPFRTDKMDFIDPALGQKILEARNDTKSSLSFYSGALLAIKRLDSLGVKVNPYPIDTQLNGSVAQSELEALYAINDIDFLIGPLSDRVLPALSNWSALHKTPIFLPSISEVQQVNSYMVQGVAKNETLRKQLLDYAKSEWKGQKLTIIHDSEESNQAQSIAQRFPNAQKVDATANSNRLLEVLTQKMDTLNSNWVFVETANLKTASSVASILSSQLRFSGHIRLWSPLYTNAFDNDVIDFKQLSDLNYTTSAVQEPLTFVSWGSQYFAQWAKYPDKIAARGYDSVMYAVLQLSGLTTASQEGQKFLAWAGVTHPFKM
ncbi:MAG: ABC transporter substrate-binding protein, partial [Flavobacteriaceae bacterium]